MAKESAISKRHSGCRVRAGFTVLELIFVTLLIGILAAIAVPTYISFIQKARETAVISYLSKAKKAQEIYSLESPMGFFSASFDELETTGMLEPGVGIAIRTEEEYQMTLAAGVIAGEPVWSISASPLAADASARHFYVDQTGVIRYTVGMAAGPGSPPL